jgi:hypothetical protein
MLAVFGRGQLVSLLPCIQNRPLPGRRPAAGRVKLATARNVVLDRSAPALLSAGHIMTNQLPDSRRPRPAVYHCAREIHFFVLRCLSGTRDRRSMLARSSAERAALAVELATAGDSPERNLPRALTAIRTSMFHCDTLYALEIIDPKTHDYLRRRVDQLIAGLKGLEASPPDQWLDLALTPLESEATEQGEAAAPTLLQLILDRVAQVARVLLPRQESSPETSSSDDNNRSQGAPRGRRR